MSSTFPRDVPAETCAANTDRGDSRCSRQSGALLRLALSSQPGVPPGPGNPLRECLSLSDVGLDYRPLWKKAHVAGRLSVDRRPRLVRAEAVDRAQQAAIELALKRARSPALSGRPRSRFYGARGEAAPRAMGLPQAYSGGSPWPARRQSSELARPMGLSKPTVRRYGEIHLDVLDASSTAMVRKRCEAPGERCGTGASSSSHSHNVHSARRLAWH